jgi:hypothetical protein
MAVFLATDGSFNGGGLSLSLSYPRLSFDLTTGCWLKRVVILLFCREFGTWIVSVLTVDSFVSLYALNGHSTFFCNV